MELTKSKERVKKLGEVFTPVGLVNEMLDKLPAEVWEADKTFLDPACGTGNFLIEVVRRKIEKGSTPLQALQTTYGIDIMEDNVQECKRRLLEVANSYVADAYIAVDRNIKCADTLKVDIEKLFSE